MPNIRRNAWQSSSRWSEEEAAEAVEEWKNSGLGPAEFARRNGITAWRLYWWRRRLAGTAAIEVSRSTFVPATIVGADVARVSVRVSTDVVIEVEGAEAAWVATLIGELRRQR